jgi:L-alanine-DL-glutamate epimerase-like enolase superfamily enzyme
MAGALAYDRRGASRMALSAIDMALIDLAARLRGESVARMLGGPVRRSVTAYASGPFIGEGDPYGHYRKDCEALARAGYRAIKPRAGRDPAGDAAMLAGLRLDLGPEMMLMIDLNQGSSVPAALALGRKAEGLDLLWIEEPLQPEDIPGYAALSGRMHAAVAGGEALGSLAAFRDALAVRAFDLLQPELTVCGGFTGFLQVAALAAAHDLPVMPHVFGGVVGSRAALQMAALLPSSPSGAARPYPLFEVDVTHNPLLALDGGVAPDIHGEIAIPDAPGIGVDLDPAELEPWLEDRWRLAAD